MSRPLIQLVSIQKYFRSSPLFEEISLSIHDGERVALIGENGAGKTTLLRLMAGLLDPDGGQVQKASALTIGYLPQESSWSDSQISVRTFLQAGHLTDLETAMDSCLAQGDIDAWGRYHEEYEQRGGYHQKPIEEVLCGLCMEVDLEAPFHTLSSGQKSKASLAKALIASPDLLLLDEPTNHLDQAAISWLQEFLSFRVGSTVIVSHDRAFLNASCNRLIDLREGAITWYGGSYDWYLAERDRKIQAQIQAYEMQQQEKRELKQAIKAATYARPSPPPPSDRNTMAYDHRGESHQKSIARTLDTLKRRLDELESCPLSHPKPSTIKGFQFVSSSLATDLAIDIENGSKWFGNKKIFSGFSKRLRRGDRVVLTGPNGCGKTTLLRCLSKQLALDAGSIRYASDVRLAYLDQEAAQLPMDETPLEYFFKMFRLSEAQIRSELHKAALSGRVLLDQPFSVLSVGQRKRLMLLSLILCRPNVLLLDEPTNHLDLLTLEAFEKALINFDGAMLAVSHDATFIEKIATQRWSF